MKCLYDMPYEQAKASDGWTDAPSAHQPSTPPSSMNVSELSQSLEKTTSVSRPTTTNTSFTANEDDDAAYEAVDVAVASRDDAKGDENEKPAMAMGLTGWRAEDTEYPTIALVRDNLANTVC